MNGVDLMEWDGYIYNVEGEKCLTYRSRDENLYDYVNEPDSVFVNHQLIKCLSKKELFVRILLYLPLFLAPIFVPLFMDVLYVSERMTMEFENMTLPELKAVLSKNKLDTTGKRADLLSRLSNYFKKNNQENSNQASKNSKSKAGTKPSNNDANNSSADSVNGVDSVNTMESSKKSDNKQEKSTSKPQNLSEGKEVTKMSMEERLLLRAKRFNLETKPSSGVKAVKLVLKEDPEALKKRSERFFHTIIN
ncbi:uncharacterized protein TA05505 [Theileria annulata]|uniref:SAP domain-containing protein n=1 Tax=Theileria annulata TaxID=5874 RepID=Q4UCQ3_THEAN|nr:uncharacterized protein TA05505 [Theileria annulata]CAI75398.1 hypothetical protein TA05505 [Theileria annulata]|eukprot:XP_954874.1 hypothetical protein TA05505 [Theileria annulata]